MTRPTGSIHAHDGQGDPAPPYSTLVVEAPHRILLIRPSALGDVCRSVPLLVSLHRAFPHAPIDWLVQEGFEPAIAHHPDLGGAGGRPIPFPRRRIALPRLWRPSSAAELRRFLASLRSPRYDLVIDAQGLGRSGLFAWWTGAATRVGFADAREMGWAGVNKRIRVEPALHTVDRMLGLLEGAGIPPIPDMRLYTSERDREAIDDRLVGKRYAVLAPTSRWAGKAWPADRFAALAQALLASPALDAVALVGAHNERHQCAPLTDLSNNEPRVVDLIGQTNIGSLMATIEACTLLVANDSAALHMGVGFDRPLVALFGPTRTDRVGPYQRDHDVIQPSPPPEGVSHKDEAAGRALMERITAAQVIDAALARLEAAPASPSQHTPRAASAPS